MNKSVLSGNCKHCSSELSLCYEANQNIYRTLCEKCTMEKIISECFKYDRYRDKPKSTHSRDSCYVEQFNKDDRRRIIDKIVATYNGKCYYTGLPIKIGSTAWLVLKIPRQRINEYGPAQVFCSTNFCWCHKSIPGLKGIKTDAEFRTWLIDGFLTNLTNQMSDNVMAEESSSNRNCNSPRVQRTVRIEARKPFICSSYAWRDPE